MIFETRKGIGIQREGRSGENLYQCGWSRCGFSWRIVASYDEAMEETLPVKCVALLHRCRFILIGIKCLESYLSFLVLVSENIGGKALDETYVGHTQDSFNNGIRSLARTVSVGCVSRHQTPSSRVLSTSTSPPPPNRSIQCLATFSLSRSHHGRAVCHPLLFRGLAQSLDGRQS